MSEINVTPLVDVMLVLLIVFMVAAPLMTVGVPIELPQTAAKQLDSQTEPLVVTVNAESKIFLMEAELPIEELETRLAANPKKDQQIFVRADTKVDYGSVMKVMGVINHAGFSKLGLVTGIDTAKQASN